MMLTPANFVVKSAETLKSPLRSVSRGTTVCLILHPFSHGRPFSFFTSGASSESVCSACVAGKYSEEGDDDARELCREICQNPL